MPLVSVITPCYNAERYLASAIESVISQTFSDWEMIVVDDCSTDGSAAIVRRYAQDDVRIRLLSTMQNTGSPAIPRNIGIENAHGRYLAFLDSDDIWLPTRLEHQIPLMAIDDAAIVFSDYRKIDADGNIHASVVTAPRIVSYKRLLHSNYCGCLTVMYDTAKVDKMYFKQRGHEDYILWLSIVKRGYRAYNTGTVEALYRIVGQSVSSNKIRAFRWQWHILRYEEGLSLPFAILFMAHYAINAYLKSRK